MIRYRLPIAAAAVALAAGSVTACGSSSDSGTTAEPPPASRSAKAGQYETPSSGSGAAGAAKVTVRKGDLGTYLTDAKGMTLYLWEKDTGKDSQCTGACAAQWPPLTTKGKPRAGKGVDAALLGTTKRADHTTEVTYKGHPLYRYQGDTEAGDTTGQGSDAFGAKWYVLDPHGKKIVGD